MPSASQPAVPDALAPSDRLICALDGVTPEEAIRSVRTLVDAVGVFKIGPALVYQGGLALANQLRQAGAGRPQIFLDMKTWDIPETVLHALDAVDRVARDAVTIVTLHTYSLDLGRLAEVRAQKDYRFKLYAVTLLTSQDETDLRGLGLRTTAEDYVLHMARRARELGCDGVISSGHEVARIKAEFGAGLEVIVPGIRPDWGTVSRDDQKRIVTPKQAILNGADRIVVGRPIRGAPDPLQAAQRIRAEIEAGLAERGGG